jgi:Ribonuclease G/E
MPRATGFDKLLDQLEAALITSRALKLKSISDVLLLAFGEATQRMSAELVRVEKKLRKNGKRASPRRASAKGA